MDNIITLKNKLQTARPLVHSITNAISINDCANIILCLGGRPIMVEHPREVAEVTANAKALMLNIGNLTDAHLQSMPIALQTANEHGVPAMLDLVGVGCSKLRRKFVDGLLDTYRLAIIKGNYSEIKALCHNITTDGVDTRPEDKNLEDTIANVDILAKKFNTTVLASGAIDVIGNGEQVYTAANGNPMMGNLTGTGCMLGAVAATYLAVAEPLKAGVSAAVAMGLAGEKAAKIAKGPGTFHMALFDCIWQLSEKDLNLVKVEKIR